jgi:hypothetical protein
MAAASLWISWLAVLVLATVHCTELSKHNTHIVHHSLGKPDAAAKQPATEVGWIPTVDTCGIDFHIPKVRHGSTSPA